MCGLSLQQAGKAHAAQSLLPAQLCLFPQAVAHHGQDTCQQKQDLQGQPVGFGEALGPLLAPDVLPAAADAGGLAVEFLPDIQFAPGFAVSVPGLGIRDLLAAPIRPQFAEPVTGAGTLDILHQREPLSLRRFGGFLAVLLVQHIVHERLLCLKLVYR